MSIQYYSLPLALDRLYLGEGLATCSLRQSIDQHLHLMLTTALGELPADENFGCNIWDHDFDNMTSGAKMKEMLRHSLLCSIEKYEKRINSIRVDLQIRQQDIGGKLNGYRTKRRVEISISGVLNATNEAYEYCDLFYTGPLSHH
ncbi:hypothetical protein EXU57_23165 [Segetibacter sp. 3557_3]|uniref:GPW/gp25 family protein n=1 Tax=Segetibacter sp. 3557_3 TaxID=2547429 RepID=UPI0010590D07|nr:GPW/gp25 family protein [Segetibacter sp. 3557_3]TDH18500.1 hypothetical protein EXU57_23165 [Segetibacter sp. 3557_3]